MFSALAQEAPLDPRSSIKIDLPGDSPLGLMSADLGESRATARGGAMVLDLRMSLSLRNSSQKRIRGVTLLVSAQEVTPGGKASVAVPSLDVGPADVFPLRIELRLLRPLHAGAGPLVQVGLDGVLFHDSSFYGPNRLDSRRSMMVWEKEAQRDRHYFKSILQAHGAAGLGQAMVDSLHRQSTRPKLDVQVARNGRTVSSAASSAGDHAVRFAFLNLPNSPVEPVNGEAQVAGNEARTPRIEVRNRSQRPVKYFEIGWIVKDREGREFWAASVPASEPDGMLRPGSHASALQDTSLRFTRRGEAVPLGGMTGFVSQVEFDDGKVWVPDRASLQEAQLLRLLAPSAEEQRLSDLYRNKGVNAVVEELKKF